MIQSFGWSDALQQDFVGLAGPDMIPGRVTVQQRGHYVLVTDQGELTAQISGRLAHDAGEGGYPVVGDWVAATPRQGEGAATIHAVLPRRTSFVRKAADSVQSLQVVAANVDLAFLVTSMNLDFNTRRLERYLATAWQSGAKPVIVLTKADLCDDPDAAVAEAEAVAFGAPVLAVSVVTWRGMDELAGYLKPGETCVLVGSSGVGKSTLVNALAGSERMTTQAIREDDSRGRHTTTHRELVLLPSGALILDTPGMRELALMDASEGVVATFSDVEARAAECRFRDCKHTNEPGCAVRAALESGELDPARLQSYRKLQKELAFQQAKEDRAAREANHRRWVAIAKANRQRRRLEEAEDE